MFFKSKYLFTISIIIVMFLIVAYPDISSTGVSQGLILSAKVVIPSLLPFMVCVLMFLKKGFFIKNPIINSIIKKIFGHNSEMFFVFVLSMLGGYPVGARLINKLYEEKRIDNKTADLMLTYCVNAGPSFVISIVGSVYNSRKIGVVLLASHLLTSFIIALFCASKINNFNLEIRDLKEQKTFSENFIESVYEASSSILSICSFVIIFSVVNMYLDYFFYDLTIIKYISLFTEVTSAVSKYKNIYVTSFLLGFSGICVWCQIFSLSDKRKINIKLFVLSRMLHGAISVILTKLFLTIFKIKIYTFSNNISFRNDYLYSDIIMFCSMFIMLTVLFIFIYSKNNSGKFINDVL